MILVGFSTGGGEVTRYIGRHGTERVAKLVLVSAVPPSMLLTDDNPGGVPIEVFDGIRAGSLADRSQLYREPPDSIFFGPNRAPVGERAVPVRRIVEATPVERIVRIGRRAIDGLLQLGDRDAVALHYALFNARPLLDQWDPVLSLVTHDILRRAVD